MTDLPGICRKFRPVNSVYAWRNTASPISLTWQDQFLCSDELLEHLPMADTHLLSGPLSDNFPIIWQSHEGSNWPTHIKMDRSWLREEVFKEVVRWWSSKPGQISVMVRLIKRIKGLQGASHGLQETHQGGEKWKKNGSSRQNQSSRRLRRCQIPVRYRDAGVERD